MALKDYQKGGNSSGLSLIRKPKDMCVDTRFQEIGSKQGFREGKNVNAYQGIVSQQIQEKYARSTQTSTINSTKGSTNPKLKSVATTIRRIRNHR